MSRLAPVLLVSALALGGCQANAPVGSVVGGECRLVRAPQYAVMGRAPYDQRWINRTTEAIVVGCRQPRPQARPPELDAPRAVRAVAPVPAKKRWWRKRVVAATEEARPQPALVRVTSDPQVSGPRVSEAVVPRVSRKRPCKPRWWRGDRWWQYRACRA